MNNQNSPPSSPQGQGPQKAPNRPSRMQPAGDDPWVAVSVIGERMYCPRGAIVEHVSEREDTGEDGIIPVGYRYGWFDSINDLRLEYRTAFRSSALFLLGLPLLAILIMVLVSRYELFGDPLISIFVILGLIIGVLFSWLYGLIYLFQGLRVLWIYIGAINAAAQAPNVNATEPQPVNWWQLLQNGYESRLLEKGLHDPDWQLLGRPWRVLQFAGLRIPVMRKFGEPKLYYQHHARIAAYCHLLELAEPGCRSPFGVVLFSPGYNGLTVPNLADSRAKFHNNLLAARKTIRGWLLQHLDPGVPPNWNKCRNCPHGYPRSSDHGETYQSRCGTLFAWTPPHERAFEKELR